MVAWWLARGRKYSLVPDIKDVGVYGGQVRGWWRAIQPEWRKEHAEGDWPLHRQAPLDEDWDLVARGGPNGLMMVMMAIGWWFGRLDDKKAVAELGSVVEDITWALRKIKGGIEDGSVVEMLVRRGGEPGNKRGREEADEGKGARNPKKRYATHQNSAASRHLLQTQIQTYRSRVIAEGGRDATRLNACRVERSLHG